MLEERPLADVLEKTRPTGLGVKWWGDAAMESVVQTGKDRHDFLRRPTGHETPNGQWLRLRPSSGHADRAHLALEITVSD